MRMYNVYIFAADLLGVQNYVGRQLYSYSFLCITLIAAMLCYYIGFEKTFQCISDVENRGIHWHNSAEMYKKNDVPMVSHIQIFNE